LKSIAESLKKKVKEGVEKRKALTEASTEQGLAAFLSPEAASAGLKRKGTDEQLKKKKLKS
jgi:hypothetical protein